MSFIQEHRGGQKSRVKILTVGNRAVDRIKLTLPTRYGVLLIQNIEEDSRISSTGHQRCSSLAKTRYGSQSSLQESLWTGTATNDVFIETCCV